MQDELSVGAQLPEKPVIGTGNPIPAKALQVGAELLEALEPFLSFAGFLESETIGFEDGDEMQMICSGSSILLQRFTYGDFRRLAAAVAARPAVAVPVGGGVSVSQSLPDRVSKHTPDAPHSDGGEG